MSRITTRPVAFTKPFLLPGMTAAHAAGTFELQVREEPLDVVWEAYQRTLTLMLTSGGSTEAWPVTDTDLEEALERDRAAGGHPAGAAT